MSSAVLAPVKIMLATGEAPLFAVGDRVKVDDRTPVGHYRVPRYLRGKTGKVEAIIQPCAVDNEQEGFGRNAGDKRHYYRVSFAMTCVWPGYTGARADSLHIEIFESWLEKGR